MSISFVDSSLFSGERDTLELLLIQAPTGQKLVGERKSFFRRQKKGVPTAAQVRQCRELLDQTTAGTLTVMSFHPGLRGCAKPLKALASDRTFVGLEGIGVDDYNSTVIAAGGSLRHHRKLSLSSEDVESQVHRGDDFTVFLPPKGSQAVRWAVFNCHDYSHVDLVRLIQEHELELVVVVTSNAATRLFWQYAISDAHRCCCYVVVANISELGGSGVFAPFRRIGREKNAQIAAGGEIFISKGPAELTIRVDIEIGKLRMIRSDFAKQGFDAIEGSRRGDETPMVPSEHFMATYDRGAGPPPISEVREFPMDWVRENLRVAVAQFTSMGNLAYVDTRYRIRDHPDCGAFETLLALRLEELEHRCQERKERRGELDLLVLPEVFVPRTFLGKLQEFSDRHQTTIIAGVDYPDGGIAANANECAVIRPREEPIYYRKITRSQYDAKTQGHDRMPLRRGDRLIRFADAYGHAFGILICYDYSHFDLLTRINLERRSLPLEMIVVVAHNPFADLYRWCCLADAHRFYQFVVMCNVAEYGGSGIFAPMRTPGARQVITEAGKGSESILLADLPLGELIRAREKDDSRLPDGEFMRRPGIFQCRW